MKEGGNFVPDARTRIEKPSDGDTSLSRRGFLKGLSALGASTALLGAPLAEVWARRNDLQRWLRERAHRMRLDKWRGLARDEREEAISGDIEQVSGFIRSESGAHILERGSDDQLFDMLLALPPLTSEVVEGTRYELPVDPWPSVAVGKNIFVIVFMRQKASIA